MGLLSDILVKELINENMVSVDIGEAVNEHRPCMSVICHTRTNNFSYSIQSCEEELKGICGNLIIYDNIYRHNNRINKLVSII